ncbi:MAG: hypothetical protein BMS9Abin22_605 [Gammaproteobacteria bacterium]|nr:MAG: hypothetical protein BMS9Abin22_605 [Gammaproteobacteria bacterium]
MTAKNLLYLFLLVLSLAWPAAGVLAGKTKIKKCQDETGKWHYGDTAAAECSQSKIIEITDRGIKTRVIAAPPTKGELKERERRREELEKERKLAEAQARKDRLLLTTYGNEKDILYVRDRKLAQIEASRQASEETLKSLRAVLTRMEKRAAEEQKGDKISEQTAKGLAQTKSQVAKHEAAIAAKRKEQEALRKRYAADLERYRELKKKQAQQTSQKTR